MSRLNSVWDSSRYGFGTRDGHKVYPSWCLEVNTTYLAPALRKRRAHWDGSQSWIPFFVLKSFCQTTERLVRRWSNPTDQTVGLAKGGPNIIKPSTHFYCRPIFGAQDFNFQYFLVETGYKGIHIWKFSKVFSMKFPCWTTMYPLCIDIPFSIRMIFEPGCIINCSALTKGGYKWCQQIREAVREQKFCKPT